MHDIQSSYEVDPNDLRLVFLVDPDKNHNQYIAKILENISYLVQPFNSFEEFKTFFLGENYLKAKALILVMEVIEQNTQTIEFINEHVINSSQNLPVVILSSDDNLLERLKIIRWGYHSLLKKYAGLSQLNDLFNRLGIVKPQRPYRVLAIDDERISLNILKKSLTSVGMEVRILSKPLLALQVIEEFDPDILLLDEYMEDVSGSELAAILQQHEKYVSLPILFVSCETDPGHQITAISKGGLGFLVKPIDPNILISTVTVILNKNWKEKALIQKFKFDFNDHQRENMAINQHAAISITDLDGNITYINNNFCKISGYTQSELLGKNHRLLKSGYHSKHYYKRMWQTISRGGIWHGTICNKNKNGEPSWWETTITPILDDRGHSQQYLSIRTDISNLKQKENDLLLQNQIQQLISNTAFNLIDCKTEEFDDLMVSILHDLAEFNDVEQAFLCKFTDDNRQLKLIYQWYEPTVEAQAIKLQNLAIAFRPWWNKKLTRNGVIKVNSIDKSTASERHWFNQYKINSFLAVPISNKEEIIGFLGMCNLSRPHRWLPPQVQLISTMASIISNSLLKIRTQLQLQKNEKQLLEAQQIAKIGHWQHNVKLDSREWSKEVFNILGFDSANLSDGLPDFYLYIHPEDLAKVKAAQKNIFKTNYIDLVYRVIRISGDIGYVHELARARYDSDGCCEKFVGTVQDITEQTLIEKELIEAREEAESSNKTKSEFLSCMSHELRTPLNAIIGFSQLLQIDDNMGVNQKNLNNEVLQAGHHLLSLIDEILDLAKIESGHLILDVELLSLDALIRECFSLLKTVIKNSHIMMSVEGETDIYIHVDRLRFKQILLNLLSNAIKYNVENGSVLLKVKVINENLMSLSITDTGIGIVEENMAKLFVPFNRLNFEKSNIEGTGIGLAITKQLVEQMGGQLKVTSKESQGSTFEVLLPTQVNNYRQESGVKRMPSDVDNETGTLQMTTAKKILCIEDNLVNLKLIEEIIALHPNIQLHSLDKAELGLEFALKILPDLILLDIRMPKMDGYQLLSLFREHKKLKEIPIVALSAEAKPTDLFKGKQAGFSAYLTKPINLNIFNAMLENYLV